MFLKKFLFTLQKKLLIVSWIKLYDLIKDFSLFNLVLILFIIFCSGKFNIPTTVISKSLLYIIKFCKNNSVIILSLAFSFSFISSISFLFSSLLNISGPSNPSESNKIIFLFLYFSNSGYFILNPSVLMLVP